MDNKQKTKPILEKEEKEIKVKLTELIFKKIELEVKTSSKYLGEKRQKDEYFDNSQFLITNLNRGLRARWNNNNPVILEFKSLFYNPYSPSKINPWYIEEIAMPFPLKKNDLKTLDKILTRLKFPKLKSPQNGKLDYDLLRTFLKEYNLEPQIIVTKIRREYLYQNSTITFDEVEGVGYFLEIESETGPENLFYQLGIKDLKIVRFGYNDMLAKGRKNLIPNAEKQKRYIENPCWNILEPEKDLVEELLRKTAV